MKLLILKNGYYWEGITNDINTYIKNVSSLYPKQIRKKLKLPMKQIIDEGPKIRYQADIWYLNVDLRTNNKYEYCLDILDHFSKCKN